LIALRLCFWVGFLATGVSPVMLTRLAVDNQRLKEVIRQRYCTITVEMLRAAAVVFARELLVRWYCWRESEEPSASGC
jgi:hypothetical protein